MCFVFGLSFVMQQLVPLVSFAIISLRKRELLILLHVLGVMWLLYAPGALGWSVIVAIPGHRVKPGNFGHQVNSDSDHV